MQAAVTVTCIVMAPFLASLGSKYVHQTIDNISLHHPDSRYICKVDIYYNIDNIMPYIFPLLGERYFQIILNTYLMY